MKKPFLYLASAALLCSSCVSMSKLEEAEAKNKQLKTEWNLTKKELKEVKAENAELLRQNQSLNADMHDMTTKSLANDALLDSMQRRIENLQLQYDTTMENYMQQITGKNRDLNKAKDLLAARTEELNSKEEAIRQKEIEFQTKQTAFENRQRELEKAEQAAKDKLAAKERELESIRNSVTNALVGFANKGMQVETKDGKVYVSMESKLMFPSASWTVSKQGEEAIRGLAKVLEENPDLNIMVEGHTDNDAYKGSTAVRDNWDLSVMRATAIVKLLLTYGPQIDPARIEACGHGEFAPKATNSTPEGKAQNRRTEIILSPKLTDVLNLLK